mmetsp:Transcript_10582/g.17764  ORF Transcript_10582/g.17764 Transcript_10582/m.17764 type:complete len:254 (+) Transcript_10582:330-1091(+)
MGLEILGVEVLDGEVDGLHAALVVVLHHLAPVDAPVVDVHVGLHVEDPADSLLMKAHYVLLGLWVGSEEDVGVPDAVEVEAAHEVGVGHLDVAVDDEDVVSVPEHVRLLGAQLALVLSGVLDVEDTRGLALPHGSVLDVVPDRVLVGDLGRTLPVLEAHLQLPGAHVLLSQPLYLVKGLAHGHGAAVGEPASELLGLSVDPHELVVLEGVIDTEVDCVAIPLVQHHQVAHPLVLQAQQLQVSDPVGALLPLVD